MKIVCPVCDEWPVYAFTDWIYGRTVTLGYSCDEHFDESKKIYEIKSEFIIETEKERSHAK